MATGPVGQTQIDHKQIVGNRYHLLGLLGAGGMGQVYRALDRLTSETVALKRIASDGIQVESNAELRLALAHEFQALAGLRHPNIIGVRDYGFDATGQPYFTMDLLYNPRTLVATGQFSAHAEKLHLLLPVLHALAYIHRRGIIHRDLKPGNILVSGTTVTVDNLGLIAFSQGDYVTARQRHEQAMRLRQEVGDRWGLATSLSNLAQAELYAKDIPAAQEHYQASMALSVELDDKRGLISCSIGLAGVLIERQPTDNATLCTALRFLAVARRLTVQIGAVLEQDEERLYAQVDETLRTILPPVLYTTTWNEGQQMVDEAMIVFLLQKEQARLQYWHNAWKRRGGVG